LNHFLEVQVKRPNKRIELCLMMIILILICTSCSSEATATPVEIPSATAVSAEQSAISPATPAEPTIAPPTVVHPTEVLPTEEPWELVLEDDFEDPNSGWERYREFDGVLDYEEGGYRMAVEVPENLFWVNANQEYADVRVEVDAKVIGGPEANRYGVLCRLGGEDFDHYFFLISSEGTYSIGKQMGWELEILSESTEPSDVIHRGIEEYNHIRADCKGDMLSLNVNGELLLEAQDSDLQKGDVGMLTGTLGEAGVDVYFDSIEVYIPVGSQESEGMMDFVLTSAAFSMEEAIPTKYSCDGENISPPLEWSDPPDGTQSFVLISDDPDAPAGTWVHWLLYNIPADARALPEAIPPEGELPDGSRHGKNSFRRLDYGGPCPPSGTHRYFFKLYALDTVLDLEPGADKETLLQAMGGHILAQSELMGTYSR
jgi:Raf kinase inhibitor-like YbhB/YbcL family protein